MAAYLFHSLLYCSDTTAALKTRHHVPPHEDQNIHHDSMTIGRRTISCCCCCCCYCPPSPPQTGARIDHCRRDSIRQLSRPRTRDAVEYPQTLSALPAVAAAKPGSYCAPSTTNTRVCDSGHGIFSRIMLHAANR